MASEDKTARGMFVVEVPHLAKLQEVITGRAVTYPLTRPLIGGPHHPDSPTKTLFFNAGAVFSSRE